MKLSMRTGMTTALLTLTAALTAGATVGCGKSAKTEGTTTTSAAVVGKDAMKGSCNLEKAASTCSEESEKSDPLGLAKGLCDALKGTWSDGPCPKANVVGTCLDKDGSLTSYYSDGDAPRDLDDSKASCETLNEGKFTALAAPKPPPAATPTPAPTQAAAKPAAKAGAPAGKPAKK